MSHIQKSPNFKYHPDPLKTKNAEEKKFQCICCNKEKEIVYVAGIYTSLGVDREELCLDCIYDGSAAKKFKATFTDFTGDAEYLDMREEDWSEFYERTPGYISWQGQIWLTHCRNICSFHGDFDPIELQQVYQDEENKSYLKESLGCNDQELNEIIFAYNPKKSTQPSFYKFKCLACKKVLAHTDFT
jgi:uncharacterized protein CbrC (UPF0167 family)